MSSKNDKTFQVPGHELRRRIARALTIPKSEFEKSKDFSKSSERFFFYSGLELRNEQHAVPGCRYAEQCGTPDGIAGWFQVSVYEARKPVPKDVAKI